jgi:hypothetical protein
MAPLTKGGKVEERKPDRFFDLVDEISGQKDVRNMGLFVRNSRGPLRVEAGLYHGGYKLAV